MKYKMKIGIVALFAVIAFSTGCKYNKEELLNPVTPPPSDCSTVAAKFSTDVLPLITSRCATPGCHDATAQGGRVFQNYAQISDAKDRINVRAVVEKTMPQGGSLSAAEINILKCWIESGAPNN
jgi:uncharacterized membrane protein